MSGRPLTVHDVRRLVGCHPAVEEYIEYCERVGIDGRAWYESPGRYLTMVVRDDFVEWLSEYAEEIVEANVQPLFGVRAVTLNQKILAAAEVGAPTRSLLGAPGQPGGGQNLERE